MKMRQRVYSIACRAASLAVMWHVFILFAVPEKFWFMALLSCAAFSLFIPAGRIMLLSLSLLAAAGLSALFLKAAGIEKNIYFEPASHLGYYDHRRDHGRYRPNRSVSVEMPHGNLPAVGVGLDIPKEPRPAVFKTDSWGFRNSRSYHDQLYILIGDSFVAGNGNTQSDILSEQLLKDHGLDTYSVAYPGYIQTYGRFIRTFEDLGGRKDARHFVFFFEGNDFPEPRPEEKASHRFWKEYLERIRSNSLYRFMYSLLTRTERVKANKARPSVSVFDIEGMKIAFLNRYSFEVTERREYESGPEFDAFLSRYKDRIERVVFIPTKYRVYRKYLNGEEVSLAYRAYMAKEPAYSVPGNAQWEFISKMALKYGIKATDLTPALMEEADRLLKDKKTVFWPDDTHWNRYGIKAAARVLAEEIKRAASPSVS